MSTVSQTKPIATVAPPAPSAEQLKAKAAKDEAKAAKEAERQAQAARAEAAARAEEERVASLRALAESAKDAAATAYNSGLKGAELKEFIAGMATKPTGAGLLSEVLRDPKRAANPRVSFSKAEYGPALGLLLTNKSKDLQALAVVEVEKYCGENNFPKYSPGAGKKELNLIEVIFQALYEVELVDENAFNAWVEDENFTTPAHTKALVQTVGFINWLNEPEEPGSDEEIEIDIDRPIV
jgi:pyruvate/2-oxoglutarate dehydrogenase complex dihydrolipoamide acyltransferase (E2) component